MKNKMLGTAFTAGILLMSGQQAFAEGDELLRGRVSIGLSSYSLTIPGAGAATASSTYTSAGAGVTYAKGNVYFDGAISGSLGATHDWTNANGEFLRSDIALTVGYVFNNGWSAFGGWKSGTSEFLQDNLPGYSLAFDAYGFYGGGSKAISLGDGKSISLSGALAFMTGDIYDNGANFGFANLDDSGSAIGLSFAAVYNIPLNDDSGMQVRGVYQNYSFRDFTTVVDLDESILGVEAGYYINF